MRNKNTSLRCVRVATLLVAAISCWTTQGFENHETAEPWCDSGTCAPSKQARSLLQGQRGSTQNVRESDGPCKDWCSTKKDPWEKKCSLKRCTGCSACVTGGSTSQKQPHVIMFMMDDLGFNDFIESPDMSPFWVHTKKAATTGIYINASYGESLCSPSRSTFMAGRPRHAIKDGFEEGSFSMADEMSLAQKLREVGYKSYGLGKWHLGHGTRGLQPVGRGFARYFGMMGNVDDRPYYCEFGWSQSKYRNFDLLYQESEPFESDTATAEEPFSRHASEHRWEYSTAVLNKYAVEFMRTHKKRFPGKPFFLYYAMYAVHVSGKAPYEYMQRCTESVFPNAHRRELCGQIAQVDDAIGELVEVMSTDYKDEHYVMIVGTDNGGASWFPFSRSSNSPLRGNKAELWEGGTRTNALVFGNHPELKSVAGTKYTGGYMNMRDWHATIAELGKYTGVMDPDALSVWSAITTNGPSPRTEMITGETEGGQGISFRMKTDGGDWKLYQNINVGGKYAHVWPIKKELDDYTFVKQQKEINGPEENKKYALFNLQVDESESDDMADKRPEIVEKLLSRVQEITKETRYSTGYDNYPCAGRTCSVSDKYPKVAACCRKKSKEKEKTQQKAAELVDWTHGGSNPWGSNPCYKGGVTTNYWEL